MGKIGINLVAKFVKASVITIYIFAFALLQISSSAYAEDLGLNAESNCKVIHTSPNVKYIPVNVIKEYIDFFIYQQTDVPGIMIGIVHEDEQAVISCGTIDKDENLMPNMQTIWPIGSVSKVLTTHILADMVNAGKVTISTEIDDLLDIKKNSHITLLHLATHSSGFPRQLPTLPENSDYQTNLPYNMEQFKEWYKSAKLEHKPGEHYQYSNVGFGLLGQLLAKVDGGSYEDLIKKEFRDKLAMKNTTTELNQSQLKRKVESYWLNSDEIKQDWDFNFERPSGGIYSTMEDLLIFLNYSLGNTHQHQSLKNNLITQASYITQNGFDNPLEFGNDSMALAWTVEYPSTGMPQILTKSGWVNGVNCYITMAPNKNKGLISFTNKPNLNITSDLKRIMAMIAENDLKQK